MSVDATRWAWQQPVKPSQKLVLLTLADRADEYFNCYPSISRMVNDTGLDRKTIIRALQSLEAEGFLSIQKTDGERNYYSLIGVSDRHEIKLTRPKNGTGRPVPKTVLDQSQKRDDHQSQNWDTNLSIEPNKNLKKETTNVVSKKIDEKRNGERLGLDTLPDTWRQFCHDERPGLDADRVFARFRDYWIAQPGAKGRKLDWFATWRNWVRNESGVNGNGARQPTGQQRKLSAVELVRQSAERYDAHAGKRQRPERVVESSGDQGLGEDDVDLRASVGEFVRPAGG